MLAHNNFNNWKEGTQRPTQLQNIFTYLENNVATSSMVTQAIGVPQKCITRFKRDLEEEGQLWEVCKGYCKKTGRMAWYLTTDPAKAPKCLSRQLNLFFS